MTTDRDGNRSNPYKPNPEMCCEACIFGSGVHTHFCERGLLTTSLLEQYRNELIASQFRRLGFARYRDIEYLERAPILAGPIVADYDGAVDALSKLGIHGDGI